MKVFYFLLLATLLFSNCKKDDYNLKKVDVADEDMHKWVSLSHEYYETDGVTSCKTTIESQKKLRVFTFRSTLTWISTSGFSQYEVITYPLRPGVIVSFTTEDVEDESIELKFIEIFKHV